MFSSYLSLLLLPTAVLSSTKVYLYSNNPQVASTSSLSQYLGLDAFDSPASYGEETRLGEPAGFVAKGESEEGLRALVLTIDSKDVLPLQVGDVAPIRVSAAEEPTVLIRRYARAAQHTYPKVWVSSSQDIQGDVLRVTEVLLRHIKGEPSAQFGGFQLTGLKEFVEENGKSSEELLEVKENLENVVKTALHSNYKVAILVPSTSSTGNLSRRQPPQSPFPVPSIPDTAPIFSTSTCFTSEDACKNATSSCSSRGSCVGVTRAGKTCFVCSCGRAPVKEGGKNVTWAGDMCQKVDVSQQFTLIVGTVLFLILVVVGSVGLLSSMGSTPLPGTLTAAASGHHAKQH